jgi:YD repeat-containing protein
MKNSLWIITGIVLVIACKKEDKAPSESAFLKSIQYSETTFPTSDKTYTLFWNASGLLDSITLVAFDPSDNRTYLFFHAGTRLDSIVSYNVLHERVTAASAVWTAGKLTNFWVLTYTYDDKGRILTKTYPGGSFFRVEYAGDSAVYYYDLSGPTPEYKVLSEYYNPAFRNPFRLKNYEAAYPIDNFVFNNISSDFSGKTEQPESQFNEYDNSGNLTGVTTFTYSGNFKGYPQSRQTFEGTTMQSTLNFTYQ